MFSVGQAANAEQEREFINRIDKKFRHDLSAAWDPAIAREAQLKEKLVKRRKKLADAHNTVER